MRIGILTYHGACNYGAYLQSCALCSRLNSENDIDAEIIDFRMVKEQNYYSSKRWSIKRKMLHFNDYLFTMKVNKGFERAHHDLGLAKKSKPAVVNDSIDEFESYVEGRYDIIVAGSDEIWNMKSFRGFPTPYWLPIKTDANKVSYAASSRVDFNKLDADTQSKIKTYLSDFKIIGVRDMPTYNSIKELGLEDKLLMCPDPSFVYSFDIDGCLKKKTSGIKAYQGDKKTILVMTESGEAAEQVRKSCGGRYNLISVFHRHKGYINIADLTPEEWLGLIKDADLVIASYFHAICFSIMQRKKFLAVGTKSKESKLSELLDKTDFEAYHIKNAAEGLNSETIERMLSSQTNLEVYDKFIETQRQGYDAFAEKLRSL